MSPLRTGGWKIIGLPVIAALVVTLSMFNCSRVSEPGVVSQKVCSDYGPQHAWPVDSTGAYTCTQTEDTAMWRGWPPNDAVSVAGVTLGGAIAIYWLFWILLPAWRDGRARSIIPFPILLALMWQDSTPVVFDTATQATKSVFSGKAAVVAFGIVIVIAVVLYFVFRGDPERDANALAVQNERAARNRKYPPHDEGKPQ